LEGNDGGRDKAEEDHESAAENSRRANEPYSQPFAGDLKRADDMRLTVVQLETSGEEGDVDEKGELCGDHREDPIGTIHSGKEDEKEREQCDEDCLDEQDA
jgi:hypothetical protein